MEELKNLWVQTKREVDGLERRLIDAYIHFLRQVALAYLKMGRRVFFGENRIVHWGEWNFGTLVIEGNEEVDEILGDYISEVRFEFEFNGTIKGEYVEIKEENIEDIRYLSYTTS